MQHKEIPIPVPKKGEILVKVEAASVNPVDWKMQGGVMRPMLPAKFPHTPGVYLDSHAEFIRIYITEVRSNLCSNF